MDHCSRDFTWFHQAANTLEEGVVCEFFIRYALYPSAKCACRAYSFLPAFVDQRSNTVHLGKRIGWCSVELSPVWLHALFRGAISCLQHLRAVLSMARQVEQILAVSVCLGCLLVTSLVLAYGLCISYNPESKVGNTIESDSSMNSKCNDFSPAQTHHPVTMFRPKIRGRKITAYSR